PSRPPIPSTIGWCHPIHSTDRLSVPSSPCISGPFSSSRCTASSPLRFSSASTSSTDRLCIRPRLGRSPASEPLHGSRRHTRPRRSRTTSSFCSSHPLFRQFVGALRDLGNGFLRGIPQRFSDRRRIEPPRVGVDVPERRRKIGANARVGVLPFHLEGVDDVVRLRAD